MSDELLKADLSAALRDIQEKNRQINGFQAKILELEQKSKQSNLPQSELIQDLMEKADKYKRIIAKQKKDLGTYTALKDAKGLVDGLESKLMQFAHEIELRDTTIQQRNEEIKTLSSQVTKIKEENLEGQVEDQKKKVGSLTAQLANTNNQIQSQTQLIAKLNAQVEELSSNDLKQELQNKSDAILILESRLFDEQNQTQQLTGQVNTLQSQVKNYQEAIQNDQTKVELQKKGAEIDKLQNSIDIHLKMIAQLENQVKTSNSELAHIRALGDDDKIKHFEESHDKIQRELTLKSNQIAVLEKRIQDSQDMTVNVEERQILIRFWEMKAMITSLKTDIAATQAELNHFKRKAMQI